MKALSAKDAHTLRDIPNIGVAMIRDFELLGIRAPGDLKGKDPYKLYQKINTLTGVRHDPCVLDTYMAACDFMNGERPRPWFFFTKERKKKYPNI